MNKDIKDIEVVFNLHHQTLSCDGDSQTNYFKISSVGMKRKLHSLLLPDGWKIKQI